MAIFTQRNYTPVYEELNFDNNFDLLLEYMEIVGLLEYTNEALLMEGLGSGIKTVIKKFLEVLKKIKDWFLGLFKRKPKEDKDKKDKANDQIEKAVEENAKKTSEKKNDNSNTSYSKPSTNSSNYKSTVTISADDKVSLDSMISLFDDYRNRIEKGISLSSSALISLTYNLQDHSYFTGEYILTQKADRSNAKVSQDLDRFSVVASDVTQNAKDFLLKMENFKIESSSNSNLIEIDRFDFNMTYGKKALDRLMDGIRGPIMKHCKDIQKAIGDIETEVKKLKIDQPLNQTELQAYVNKVSTVLNGCMKEMTEVQQSLNKSLHIYVQSIIASLKSFPDSTLRL